MVNLIHPVLGDMRLVTSIILGWKSHPHQWSKQEVIKTRSRWERFARHDAGEIGPAQKPNNGPKQRISSNVHHRTYKHMCKTNSLKARKGSCNLKEKKKNVIHRESNEVLRKFSSRKKQLH